MKIRTGLTTLCALVVILTSCSFFQRPKQRTLHYEYPSTIRYRSPSIDKFLLNLKKDVPISQRVQKMKDLIEEERWFETVQEARGILKKDPENARAMYGIAIAYSNLNRIREGIVHFDKAMQFDPEFESPRLSLDDLARQICEGAVEHRKYDDAISMFKTYIGDVKTEQAKSTLESWISNAHFQFGEAAYLNEDYKTAAKHLSKVVDQYPMNCRVWRRLGISYLKIGDPKKAIRIFEHTEKHESDKEDLPLLLYSRAFSTFDKKKRAELLERAVKAWPNYRFDFLEEAVESIVSYYRSKRDRKGTLNLINSNLPEPDKPDLDKRICIHATFFTGIPCFPLYKDVSKESYTFYFTQLFNYFRKKKSLANAARALYGKFIFDQDWDDFKKEYATLGDHLRPPKQVKHMLKRFFVWDD